MSTVPVVLALTQNCQERERVCLLGVCAWVCDTHGGGGSSRHAVLIPWVAVLSYFAPKRLCHCSAARCVAPPPN